MEDKQLKDLEALMCGMWEDSETGFEEFKSCDRMCALLENYGFQVERNVCDMQTAYVATMGHGKPVIAILAEYDALYGMSQEADVAVETPLKHTDKGHGCGHHLLGVGAVSTGLSLIDYLKTHPGTIRVIGCPAEESGSGKAYLARDGAFDDVDIALTWHPGKFNQVSSGSAQSCIQAYYRFYGKSSHAAAAPEIGRSALDACELMNIGVNYLREHMAGFERVHYAYTNVGGKSPNVVQSFAELKYLIRSNNNANVMKLYNRVADIAKGAALMSGVTYEVIFDEGLSNVIPNYTLENMLRGIFKNKTLPTYTKEELEYAQKFKDSFKDDPTLGIKDIENIDEVKKYILENPLCDIYVETKPNDTVGMGSTDVGDVSWVVPTAQINTATFANGAGAHSWQWVAQGKSSIALKGTILASEVLSEAVIYLLEHPEVIKEAKKEFDKRLEGQSYTCLIPKDVKPHLIQ